MRPLPKRPGPLHRAAKDVDDAPLAVRRGPKRQDVGHLAAKAEDRLGGQHASPRWASAHYFGIVVRGSCDELGEKQGHKSKANSREDEVQKLIATATLGCALALATSAAAAQPLGIGTSPQGTMTYRLGAALSKVLAEAGIQSRVQPQSGTGDDGAAGQFRRDRRRLRQRRASSSTPFTASAPSTRIEPEAARRRGDLPAQGRTVRARTPTSSPSRT